MILRGKKMSRVKIGQKYVNENKYNSIITGPSKLIRIHSEIPRFTLT